MESDNILAALLKAIYNHIIINLELVLLKRIELSVCVYNKFHYNFIGHIPEFGSC